MAASRRAPAWSKAHLASDQLNQNTIPKASSIKPQRSSCTLPDGIYPFLWLKYALPREHISFLFPASAIERSVFHLTRHFDRCASQEDRIGCHIPPRWCPSSFSETTTFAFVTQASKLLPNVNDAFSKEIFLQPKHL